MVTYSNGYIPSSLLVTFNVGRSAGEGEWKHQLSPATYAKHLALVALARKNTGRTLTLSNGWSGYRPYSAQVYARQRYGNGAAWPGTSSHGGFWEGQQTLAIDYGNWSYVYNGSRDAFYRDCRAVGFEPGLISPQRGYPDEPWHVVDKNPWAAVGAVAGGAGGTTKPKEWDEMATQDEIMAGFRKIVKEEVVAEVAKAVKQYSRSGAYKIVGVNGPPSNPGPHMKLVGPEGEADLKTDDEVWLLRRFVQALPFVADQPFNPASKFVSGEERFTPSQWAIVTKVLARMKPAKG